MVGAQAPLDCSVVAVDQCHRQAGIQKGGGNAAAHGARANNGHAGNGGGSDARPNGNLARRALGEEQVTLRDRLPGRHQLLEELPLALQAFVEGKGRRLDCLYDVAGRLEPAEFARVRDPISLDRGL